MTATSYKRTLITAALPYANGSLHLGHMVEYCQADMYKRALIALGQQAIYVCASDAHGTPIEINAKKQGITPESLVQKYYEEHKNHFALFDINFDHYGLTHSPTNQRVVEDVYAQLLKNNAIEEREIDGNWCPNDQRFLPDRFIKGACPKCATPDQYGDVCEKCGATYQPTDVIQPKCALCGTTPEIKSSKHLFVKLNTPACNDFLRSFIDSGALQPDVANYVRHWLEQGLKDWCISRDGPYFGFPIPEHPNKYFYVWLDAPFGYTAASIDWAQQHQLSFNDLWKSSDTRIVHFIGKDIVYFHTLFWPAVLNAIGYNIPQGVFVHGMLTINGEKMSKSRGTFILAKTFADHIDPQALRYYYACKYGSHTDDLDLSFEDFMLRVNGELVNKHANLFSRMSQFVTQKLDGKLGALPFSQHETHLSPSGDGSLLSAAQLVVQKCKNIEQLYLQREFSHIIRELSAIADIGNEIIQARKPWDEIKTDIEQARLTCTFAANVCEALAMYLAPIVPTFAQTAKRILNVQHTSMNAHALFHLQHHTLGQFERLFDRIDPKTIEALMQTSTPSVAKAPVQQLETPIAPEIDYAAFQNIDLRVGQIIQAEPVPKSQKLLKLMVDIGEEKPRQIISGIALSYTPEQLIHQKVLVVANLKAAKLMGHESRGMILAAGEPPHLTLIHPHADAAPGAVVR